MFKFVPTPHTVLVTLFLYFLHCITFSFSYFILIMNSLPHSSMCWHLTDRFYWESTHPIGVLSVG